MYSNKNILSFLNILNQNFIWRFKFCVNQNNSKLKLSRFAIISSHINLSCISLALPLISDNELYRLQGSKLKNFYKMSQHDQNTDLKNSKVLIKFFKGNQKDIIKNDSRSKHIKFETFEITPLGYKNTVYKGDKLLFF